MDENEIGRTIVDCAIAIHRSLGPGLLESVYEAALNRALSKRGLNVERQAPITFEYDGQVFEEGFRADLVVDGLVIVELKSVETMKPVHKKQVLTYLRLSKMRLGFLLNFGSAMMKDGIVRIVNGLPDV